MKRYFGGHSKAEVLYAIQEVLTGRRLETVLLRLTGNDGRGMTYKEVAEKVGISAGNTKDKYLRSCKQVHYFLEKGIRKSYTYRVTVK